MLFLLGCATAPFGRETVDGADVILSAEVGLGTWADAEGADVLLGATPVAGCIEDCPGTQRVTLDANAHSGGLGSVCDYPDAPQPRFIGDLTGDGQPEFASGQTEENDARMFGGDTCSPAAIAWLDVGSPLLALGSIAAENVVFGAPDLGAVYLFPGDRRGGTTLGEGAAALTVATGDTLLGAAGATADLDGDGLDDLVVTGSRVWVFTNAGGFERATDAADAAGPGWSAEDGHGLDVADIDGDGHLDVLTGDTTGNVVSVLHGPVTGALSAWATITGAGAFGADVAADGDVNGDGSPDVLIGTPDANDGRGGAWLVLGPVGSGAYAVSEDDGEFVGLEDGGAVGATVLMPGDGDADGLADLALVAPGFGGVYVFRGRE